MGETMAYGAGAMLALLAVDALTGSICRRPDAATTGTRLLQASRRLCLVLLAGALATSCRPGTGILDDLQWMATFGLAGRFGIEVAQKVGFAVMRGLGDAARGDNLAATIAACAHTIAIGILVANVAAGSTPEDLALAAVAFAIGQASLLVLVWAFRWLTTYDDREEILGGNVAAALSHGGLTLALALLIAHASDGEFVGFWPSMRDYGVALAEGLVFWPLRQLLLQCLILRARPTLFGGALDRAVAARDLGIGALEAGTYLGLALFVRSLA